jgi:hypothetical protein
VTMTNVDADHAIRVIRARCSDAIAPSDLDQIEAALTGRDDEMLSREVAERIVEVIDALETRVVAMDSRLDAMEEGAKTVPSVDQLDHRPPISSTINSQGERVDARGRRNRSGLRAIKQSPVR